MGIWEFLLSNALTALLSFGAVYAPFVFAVILNELLP
jgi:hypothetical protein